MSPPALWQVRVREHQVSRAERLAQLCDELEAEKETLAEGGSELGAADVHELVAAVRELLYTYACISNIRSPLWRKECRSQGQKDKKKELASGLEQLVALADSGENNFPRDKSGKSYLEEECRELLQRLKDGPRFRGSWAAPAAAERGAPPAGQAPAPDGAPPAAAGAPPAADGAPATRAAPPAAAANSKGASPAAETAPAAAEEAPPTHAAPPAGAANGEEAPPAAAGAPDEAPAAAPGPGAGDCAPASSGGKAAAAAPSTEGGHQAAAAAAPATPEFQVESALGALLEEHLPPSGPEAAAAAGAAGAAAAASSASAAAEATAAEDREEPPRKQQRTRSARRDELSAAAQSEDLSLGSGRTSPDDARSASAGGASSAKARAKAFNDLALGVGGSPADKAPSRDVAQLARGVSALAKRAAVENGEARAPKEKAQPKARGGAVRQEPPPLKRSRAAPRS